MFAAPLAASADEILVAGVSLPVEEIRIVDQNSVKLVLGDRSEVLPRAAAELLAVENVFSDSNAGLKYPLKSLEALVLDLAARGPSASKALSLVFDTWFRAVQKLVAEQQLGAVRGLLASEPVTAFLNTAPITGLLDNQLGMQIIAELSTREPDVFAIRVAGIPSDAKVLLADWLRNIALSAAALRDFDRAGRAARALLNLRADSDARSVTVFVQRLKEALDAEQGDGGVASANRLFELLDSTSGVPNEERYRDALIPFLVEAVHRLATTSISQGKFDQSLAAISRIPLSKRTPTTHRLLISALNGLNDLGGLTALREPPVAKFLQRWAAVDPSVSKNLRASILRVGEIVARDGDPSQVEELISAYDLEPQVADELRRFEVLGFLARGHVQSARAVAARIVDYSMFDTLRFMRHGLNGGVFSLVCYGISFVLLIALIAIRLRSRSLRKADLDRADEEAAEKQRKPNPELLGHTQRRSDQVGTNGSQPESDEITGGFMIDKARMMSPMALEYRKLLAVFGLQPSATLKDIKQAYRTKVKSVHPDLNPELSESGRAEFIELTQGYERLIALRDEIGL